MEAAIPASGNPMDVAGEAILRVTMRPASGVDHTEGQARETYRGPERVDASGVEVIELVQVEDFENVLTWAIGLEGQADVAVGTLDEPDRLVVDIAAG